MFCRECGAKIFNDAKFCTHCGAQITAKESSAESGTVQQISSVSPADYGFRVGDFGMMKDSTIRSETQIIGTAVVGGSQIINIAGEREDRATRTGEHCPLCGMLAKDDYFKCTACGRNFICRNHMDPTDLVCTQCSEAVAEQPGISSREVLRKRHEELQHSKQVKDQVFFQTSGGSTDEPERISRPPVISQDKPKPVRRFQQEHEVSTSYWYEIDGFKGCEMPTLFQYCVLALREYGEVKASIRKDINIENTINNFKRHWRLENYSLRFEVSADEWQFIFDSLRTARRF